MKSLFRYFRNYKKQSILSPVFKCLEACFELIVPLVIASIIDNGIANGDKNFIVTRVLLLCAFAVIGIVCAICAQYFAAYAACGISSDIRFDLFKKISGMSFEQVENLGGGMLTTSLTADVNQISSGINMVLRLVLRSPLIVLGATIMAFTVNAQLALIFLGADLILSVFVYLNMRSAIPAYHETRESLDNLASTSSNGLAGVRVIRGYNRTGDDLQGFRKQSSRLNVLQKYAAGISAGLNPVTYLLINFAICFLIYCGAIKVDSGTLTQGEVVALYNYMSQILIELIKFANTIVIVSRALACADRIAGILEIPEDTNEYNSSLEQKPHSISFKDVSYTYTGGSEPAVEDLTFELEAGKTYGIIGTTGCGKSTLASLIGGIYPATTGEILIDGIPMNDVNRKSLRDGINYAFQKTRMFTGSIRENITLGRNGFTEERIKNICDISCASDVIERKSEGLEYKVEANGSGLSGGQKQRIGIARALINPAGLLILDDSTSALDSATEKKLLENLGKMKGEVTSVIISQKIRTVRGADKIMLMDDGKIEAFAPHDELLQISEHYRNLCSLQREE